MTVTNNGANPAPAFNLAITGMGLRTLALPSLEAYERLMFSGSESDQSSVPGGPPANGRHPSEYWLEAPDGALATALDQSGRWSDDTRRDCTALVLLASVPASSNLASGLAQRFSLCGPVYTDGGDTEALVRALHTAQNLLSEQNVDGVIIASVSEHAAAAVLLERWQPERKAYAVLDGVAAYRPADGPTGPDAASALAAAVQAVRQQTRQDSAQAGCVVLSAPDTMQTDGLRALAQVYPAMQGELITAIDGERWEYGPLTGMIRAGLALSRRSLPVMDSEPELATSVLTGSALYVASTTRPWFEIGQRGAEIGVIDGNGISAAVTMRECEIPLDWKRRLRGSVTLLPVSGSSIDELLENLTQLNLRLFQAVDLSELSAGLYERYSQSHEYAAAILARDAAEAQREIGFALKGIPTAVDRGTDWQTPGGSCFSPQPLGEQGHTAFVYPGAFNSYVGMGTDLFRYFPQLFGWLTESASDIGRIMRADMLYPRSQQKLTASELAEYERALSEDAISMLNSGTVMSVMHTMILRRAFDVQPGATFGYSLGENSMLFGMQVWTSGDETSQRLSESGSFRHRLSGPLNAVRQFWGLPQAAENTPGESIWRNYLLMAAPDAVLRALQDEDRVYLTHINTPRQVVIGGDPQGCRRVIEQLHCAHLQAPFQQSLHNPAMASEYNELVYLHDWPLNATPNVHLYSAAAYEPVRLERGELAQNIARTLCTPLDFPRLVERVYTDGARIFIETGAGSNCAKWVGETLKGRPHLAVSMDRKGVDDYSAVLRVVARLVSHRATINLMPLYQEAHQNA
jgi:PfaB family protein